MHDIHLFPKSTATSENFPSCSPQPLDLLVVMIHSRYIHFNTYKTRTLYQHGNPPTAVGQPVVGAPYCGHVPITQPGESGRGESALKVAVLGASHPTLPYLDVSEANLWPVHNVLTSGSR